MKLILGQRGRLDVFVDSFSLFVTTERKDDGDYKSVTINVQTDFDTKEVWRIESQGNHPINLFPVDDWSLGQFADDCVTEIDHRIEQAVIREQPVVYIHKDELVEYVVRKIRKEAGITEADIPKPKAASEDDIPF